MATMMGAGERMGSTCCFLGMLAALLLFLPSGTLCQERVEQHCLSGNGTEEMRPVEVRLLCEAGLAVSVEEASLSRNTVLCGRAAGDCRERIDVFSQQCDGRRACTVQLRKTYTRQCGYATYLRVIYACIPETRLPTPESTQDPSPLRLTPEGQGHGNQDRVSSPSPSTIPYPGPRTQPTTSPDDMALIVGCAVAVVITTIILIVAIVLVVRRLLSSGVAAERGKKRGGLGLFRGCADFGCFKPPPPYPSTSAQTSSTAAASASGSGSENRPTPVGAPSDPNLADPNLAAPNPVPAGHMSISTVVTAHAQPGHMTQHVQPMQHVAHVQQGNPGPSVPSASTSSSRPSSRSRFDAVGLPNTETASNC